MTKICKFAGIMVIAVLVLAAAPADVVSSALPWTTWEDLAAAAVVVDEGRCVMVRVTAIMAVNRGVRYMFWVAPATQAVVVAVFPRGDTPSAVGTGRIDPKRPERIPALAWADYDPDLHTGGPCAFLNPLDA